MTQIRSTSGVPAVGPAHVQEPFETSGSNKPQAERAPDGTGARSESAYVDPATSMSDAPSVSPAEALAVAAAQRSRGGIIQDVPELRSTGEALQQLASGLVASVQAADANAQVLRELSRFFERVAQLPAADQDAFSRAAGVDLAQLRRDLPNEVTAAVAHAEQTRRTAEATLPLLDNAFASVRWHQGHGERPQECLSFEQLVSVLAAQPQTDRAQIEHLQRQVETLTGWAGQLESTLCQTSLTWAAQALQPTAALYERHANAAVSRLGALELSQRAFAQARALGPDVFGTLCASFGITAPDEYERFLAEQLPIAAAEAEQGRASADEVATLSAELQHSAQIHLGSAGGTAEWSEAQVKQAATQLCAVNESVVGRAEVAASNMSRMAEAFAAAVAAAVQ